MFLHHLIAILALVVATHVDIRKREVPDWVTYGTTITGVIIGLITTIVTIDYWPLLSAIIGGAIGFGIGLLMYYGGQWGGGDAKLLMGLGTLFGFSLHDRLFINFVIMLIFAGAIYGVLVSVGMAVKHRTAFKKAFQKRTRTKQVMRTRVVFQIIVVIALLLAFFALKDPLLKIGVVVVAAGAYLLYYSFIFAKTLEDTCMKKRIPVGKLVEGDWVLEEVTIGRGKSKKVIACSKSGITLEEIAALKKAKIKDVLVKEGIAFVPSFLLAYAIVLIYYVWLGKDVIEILFTI